MYLKPPSLRTFLLGGNSFVFIIFGFFFVNATMQTAGYDEILRYGELGVLLVVLIIIMPGFLMLLKNVTVNFSGAIAKISEDQSKTVANIIDKQAEVNKTNIIFYQEIIKSNHSLTYNLIGQTAELRQAMEEQTKEIERLVELIQR